MDSSIESCVKYLRERGAEEVYVFGSYARATNRDDSDIDFAVAGLPENRYFSAVADLLILSGKKIDLVLLDDGSDFSERIRSKIAMGYAKRVG